MAGNIKGITIEFDGDVSKLQSSLKNANKSLRDTSKNLRDVDKLLKFNPGNTELIAQKQKYLSTQVDETKKKLEALKKADENAKKQLANGQLGQEEYDKLRREIIETESKLNHFQGQLNKLNPSKVEQIGKKFEQAGEKIKNVGSKVADFGKSMTMKVTAPIVALGTASFKAWEEYDDAIDNIIKATGATGDAVEGFEKVYKDVFTSLPVDAADVSGAIGELNTQFGFTDDRLKSATEYMLKFSEITGQDTVSATQGAKKAMELFNLESSELESVLDRVAKVSQDTGVGSEQLFDAIQKGAPQIKAMGLSFDEGAVLIGNFEKAGIDSSKALGYMTKAQVNFAKEGKTLEEGLAGMQTEMAGMSSETDKLNYLTEVFGSKGAPFMLEALESGTLSFEDLAKSAQNASGTVGQTFEDTQDPADQMKVAFNNLKTAGAELGGVIQEKLGPVFEEISKKIQDVTKWFTGLSDEQQDMVVKIGLIVAAIGPVLFIFGKLTGVIGGVVGAFGKLIPFIASNPIVLIIAAVVGAVALLIANWDWVKEKAGQLWESITQVWEGIKTSISNAWTAVSDKTVEIWNGIKATLSNLWEGIKTTVTNAVNSVKESIANVWNSVKETTANVWNGIKGAISRVWEGIKTTVSNAVNGVRNVIQNVFNTVKGITDSIWNGIKTTISGVWSGIKTGVSNAVNGVKTTVSNVFSGLKTTVSNVWNGIKSAIETPINKAKEIVSNVINKIKGLFNFKFTWPKLKMPHFSIKGSMNPLKWLSEGVPKLSVDWYAQGGIFDKPTVIGVGEAGQEAVLPTHKLDNFLEEAVSRVSGQGQGSGITINIENAVVREESDIRRIAEEVNRLFEVKKNRFRSAGGMA